LLRFRYRSSVRRGRPFLSLATVFGRSDGKLPTVLPWRCPRPVWCPATCCMIDISFPTYTFVKKMTVNLCRFGCFSKASLEFQFFQSLIHVCMFLLFFLSLASSIDVTCLVVGFWFYFECTTDPSASVCTATAGLNNSGGFSIVEFACCRLCSYFFLTIWVDFLLGVFDR
jgi:hypothetical protein